MKYSVAAVFLCLLVFNTTASATFYRWVDDNGKVHYSDSVPPSEAQKGHTEMDQLGNKVKKVGPAKSEEQVAEEEWLVELEDKLKAKKLKQQRKDRQLLKTYANLEQFDDFYEQRFKALNSERKQLELLHDKLEEELAVLLQQSKDDNDEETKEKIQSFIDINLENTKTYQNAIKRNLAEEGSARDEVQQLRQRFIHLKEKREQAWLDRNK